MIKQYPKGLSLPLSKNFDLKEFHCHCELPSCVTTFVSEELVTGLQVMRDYLGPLHILSGFRCADHNAQVGGAADSKHMLGIAADVTHDIKSPENLRKAAIRVLAFSQGGIGLYRWGVHVDVRGRAVRWIG